MKWVAAVLLALFFIFPSLAIAEDLSVTINSPQGGAYPGEIANCPAAVQSGTPTRVDSQFTITNPWPVSMSVWYDYYDFGTDEWVEGSHPICNVPPSMTENMCKVTTPLSLGGRGLGTLTKVPYLRLKGTDPDGKRQALTRTLSYTFNHFESETETNTKVKITALGDLIATMGSGAGTCYLDFCCGASGTILESAKAAKSAAEASLKACNLPAAYNGAASAINSLTAASVPSDPACISAVAAANSAAAGIASVKEKLAAPSECDTSSASEKLADAETALSGASAKLMSNDFSQASALASTAKSAASEAEAAIACATPPSGTAPSTTPASTPSTQPVPSPSPTTPANEPVPSGGSTCPLGLAVLLGGLLAAWRQKVR